MITVSSYTQGISQIFNFDASTNDFQVFQSIVTPFCEKFAFLELPQGYVFLAGWSPSSFISCLTTAAAYAQSATSEIFTFAY